MKCTVASSAINRPAVPGTSTRYQQVQSTLTPSVHSNMQNESKSLLHTKIARSYLSLITVPVYYRYSSTTSKHSAKVMNLCGKVFRRQLLLPFLFHSTKKAFVSSYSINMAPFVTTRENGVITVSPKTETNQNGLVVICHGLGDSAEGFVDVAEVSVRSLFT